MKLNELKLVESKQLEIEQFLKALGKDPLSNTYEYASGVLNVLHSSFSFPMEDIKFARLPIKFGKVSGSFMVSTLKNLTSLENFPDEIGKGFYCSQNKITSFKGITPKIGGSIIAVNLTKFKSMIGIDNHIKDMNGDLAMSFHRITKGGLGLLNIPGLRNIKCAGINVSDSLDLPPPFKIIDSHLSSKERDIFKCQQELIDAGFEEYAKL